MIKKLTDEQVHGICKLMEDGCNNTEIGKIYNINPVIVSQIRCGKSHRHISKNYNLESLNLSDEQVHGICKLMEDGYSNTEIAKSYNMNRYIVSNIRCGKTYTHISKNYNLERRRDHVLTDEQVHGICKLLEDGLNNVEIAKRYNVNPSTISIIRRGLRYTDIYKNYNIRLNSSHDSLDIEKIHKICRLLEEGYKNNDISIDCSVNKSLVSLIRNGYIHKEISKNYNIERNIGNLKIKDEVIHEVCRLLQEGYKYKDISKITNVSETTIYKIKTSERYKDVSSQYNFTKNKKNL